VVQVTGVGLALKAPPGAFVPSTAEKRCELPLHDLRIKRAQTGASQRQPALVGAVTAAVTASGIVLTIAKKSPSLSTPDV